MFRSCLSRLLLMAATFGPPCRVPTCVRAAARLAACPPTATSWCCTSRSRWCRQVRVYSLAGFDDQCGAGERATAVGAATLNHDGTIEVGLDDRDRPGGAPVHVDARVAVSSLSGPWTDSAGNAGTLAPLPASLDDQLYDRPAAIANRLAEAGAAERRSRRKHHGSPSGAGRRWQRANRSHPVQARVAGTCRAGDFLRSINPNGTVICRPLPLGSKDQLARRVRLALPVSPDRRAPAGPAGPVGPGGSARPHRWESPRPTLALVQGRPSRRITARLSARQCRPALMSSSPRSPASVVISST